MYAASSNRKSLVGAPRLMFCSAKTPNMTHFGQIKCAVSLWERQFATLCLFHTGGGFPGFGLVYPDFFAAL